uniref:NADH dehydrogenase subunit 6 n=1 Tax=Afurcagobius suppositus TaxID=3112639 RepID=UPI0030028745|nr:NADH dehydrogenase subunit 6 [Afurcagobius suppositus]
MSYMMMMMMQGLLLGVVVVVSNPSPYFAALGLVVVAGMGCGLMIVCGGAFLSLVLFLIYLGGMLVVFAYSSALASEAYPEVWSNPRIVLNSLVYFGLLLVAEIYFSKGWYNVAGGGLVGGGEFSGVRGELAGVGLMYSTGGWLLLVGGWVLLLTLFVVLEVVRGQSRGALRAV